MTDGIVQKVFRKYYKEYESMYSWSQDWTIITMLNTLQEELIVKLKQEVENIETVKNYPYYSGQEPYLIDKNKVLTLIGGYKLQ